METVLFIKPIKEFAIVIAFEKDSKVYIHDASIFSDIESCICYAKNILQNQDPNYPLVKVVFDASIYAQEAFSLRDLNLCNITLHSPKKKPEHRIMNNANSIKSFIFRKTQTDNYSRFMNIYESFNQSDYNIALDILSDVSAFYQSKV